MVVISLKEGVEKPKYQTEGASGMDVIANSIKTSYKGDEEISESRLEKMQDGFNERGYIKIRPFERILFGTGIFVSNLDKNLEIQARPRSGVTLKRGLMVANSPGTIDEDYRGEIGIIIYNSTPFLSKIQKDERIAQIVFAKVEKPVIYIGGIDPFSTERGNKGFGSTGKKEFSNT